MEWELCETPLPADGIAQAVHNWLGRSEEQWAAFHDMDVMSTSGHIWHKGDGWLRAGIDWLIAVNIAQHLGCRQLRSEILSAEIAPEAAHALGNYQAWIRALRTLTSEHQERAAAGVFHQPTQKDAPRESIKELGPVHTKAGNRR